MLDRLSAHLERLPASERADFGAVTGPRGVHTSRTLMLADLGLLLQHTPTDAGAADLRAAIVDGNALGKASASTRRASAEKLHTLYGLDPGLPLFAHLRRLWTLDPPGRPLLALLTALARDPVLRATAPAVLGTSPGEPLPDLQTPLEEASGGRWKPATAARSAKYCASSWTQSGHLRGHSRKVRQAVAPTPASAVLALRLATLGGAAGRPVLDSPWLKIFDGGEPALLSAAREAAHLGLLSFRVSHDDAAFSFPERRRANRGNRGAAA